MIRDEFFNAVSNYSSAEDIASMLWKEIEDEYSDPSRHYHNLLHLESLILELIPVKARFTNWSVVVFAVVYHDIVYKAIKSDNEEKSAQLAVQRLNGIAVPEESVDRCRKATRRQMRRSIFLRMQIFQYWEELLMSIGYTPPR
jgi:predicted metal-dependent HD superfamily phosphohydrolase